MNKASASYSVTYRVRDASVPDGVHEKRFHIKAWSDEEAIKEGRAHVSYRNAISFEILRETKEGKTVIDNSNVAS
ncbi:MAG TPA: hypothetical protein VJP60_01650 [Rhizomicrobium sp.]|nr:hypothetical protein [Rhizomicrobium sp.]